MYGIRAAIVQAAMDEEGLTLLNFIKKYPTDMHFDGETLEERARAVDLLIRASEHFITKMITLSEMEAASESDIDFSKLPDPTVPGPYGVAPKDTWNLVDASRDRSFYVDVYRPQQWKPGKTPVLVLSHGLASRPEDFDIAAKKMASYGFVVALPQHPGSDFTQAQALLNRTSRQGYFPSDFIDRPKDISYVIDELERRNASEFGGRLNLTQVGVGGHSFGGYGALAVGGATIDWDFLESECRIGQGVPNTALLLQCDALTLPRSDYDFRDPRVVAVLAANPVNSAVFGIKGLHQVKVPVLMLGGSYDPATPFVLEQARSFPRLGSRKKYLTLMEGQAHVDFSKLDINVKAVTDSMDAINLNLPDPNLLHSYGAAVMVPFFQVYVAGDESFRPLVDNGAAHAAYLSRDQEFKFFLISQKSEGSLIEDIAEFRRANGLPFVPNEFPAEALSNNSVPATN
jgi:predicted dienelactone hydrolase